MILVDDIHVYINKDMPSGMEEMVSPNMDGTYTILLNGSLSHERQTEAFWHAIRHIEHNDFERVETYGIQLIESEAHEGGTHGFIQEKGIVAEDKRDARILFHTELQRRGTD